MAVSFPLRLERKCQMDLSRQGFVLGQTEVPDEPRLLSSVATSDCRRRRYDSQDLPEHLESVRTLAGKTATMSFWQKSDAARPLKVSITQYLGPTGSESV